MASVISRRVVAASIVLALSVVWLRGALAATITLKSAADVVSSTVNLGDVSTISSSNPSEQLGTLRAIRLCAAPPPAESVTLGRDAVVSALRAAGLNMSSLKFAGSHHVVVRRVYELVTLEELQREFSAHVSRQTGWAQDSYLLSLPKNFLPVPVPSGQRTMRVDTSDDEDFSGSVLARFHVTVDGEPCCELVHRFDVERYVEALIAARKIARGQPVTASDVEVRKIEQGLVDGDTFTAVAEAVGLVATRTIRPGTILNAELLAKPAVIQKGKDASVIWKGDGFCITTIGRVLEDGSASELVRVRLGSRKIVRATVLDSDTLLIAREGDKDEKVR